MRSLRWMLAAILLMLLTISPAWAKAFKRSIHPQAPAQLQYTSPDGFYRVLYPPGWNVTARTNAMIIKSGGDIGDRGVFGIALRDQGVSNDEAVKKEFGAPNKPMDLVQMPSRVAGLPAIKVIGSSKDDPNSRMVEYYVSHPSGREYYIMLLAPQNQWPRFAARFNRMLQTLSFQ